MVTDWVQADVLPEASVTVQVTTVTPEGKVSGALFDTSATSQLSAVTGVPNDTFVLEAVHNPLSAGTVTGEGQVIVGFSRSCIITVCEQVAVLPCTSDAVHMTVVDPIG